MKKYVLAIAIILLANSATYAGDPYVKAFYKNKQWTVTQVGITGELKACTLTSSPHYLDKAKNPKFGTTYLEVSYPNNNVTFSGKNTGAYFRTSKQIKLQVDDGALIPIKPENPILGKSIVENMLKGKVVKIQVNFDGGDPSIHTFSLAGFAEAYKKLPDCAK